MSDYDKEFKKLEDLEWEYNITKKFCEDEAEVIVAYHKYRRQYRKVLKMQQRQEEEAK